MDGKILSQEILILLHVQNSNLKHVTNLKETCVIWITYEMNWKKFVSSYISAIE